LVVVQKFDWVFDGNDVASLGFINVIKQGRQSGRLARAARPRQQNEPVAYMTNLSQALGQAKCFEIGDDRRNHPHHNGTTASLNKNIDSKSRYPRQCVRDIAVALLAK